MSYDPDTTSWEDVCAAEALNVAFLREHPVRPQPTVAELLAAAEHYQRARDWDGDTARGEAAMMEAGHTLQDLCRRIGSEGIQ